MCGMRGCGLAVLIFPACMDGIVALPGACATRLSVCTVRAFVKHVPCMYMTCDMHVALLPYTYHAAGTVCACEMHVAGMYVRSVCIVCVVHDCTRIYRACKITLSGI